MGFLAEAEVRALGLRSVGRNVQISSKASLYGTSRIGLGNDVRIDDFCILSAGEGGIELGDHVHIACHVSMIGAGRIHVDDFAGISSHSAVYSSSDDFSGATLTGPTVPDELRAVHTAAVLVGRHVIVGAGCVILPGVTLNEGCAVGAMSLVRSDLEPFTVYAGRPARRIADRRRDLLQLEQRLRKNS